MDRGSDDKRKMTSRYTSRTRFRYPVYARSDWKTWKMGRVLQSGDFEPTGKVRENHTILNIEKSVNFRHAIYYFK